MLEERLIDIDQMMELDVAYSHSRPLVSNDNPFSKSQFKIKNYQPAYPGRFNDFHHARLWTQFGTDDEVKKSRKRYIFIAI